jgi:hypothetical protein
VLFSFSFFPHPLELTPLFSQDERAKKAKKAKGNGMTEEEMLKAQEELFAASRARFESGAAPAPADGEATA